MLDTVDFPMPNESLSDCNVGLGKVSYLLIILTLSSRDNSTRRRFAGRSDMLTIDMEMNCY